MNNVRIMRYHTRTRTMGSIEVYDAKQEKWVLYVPDYNAWYQHFNELRDGYVHPDHMGCYVLGSGKKYRKLKEIETREKEMEGREKQLEAREKTNRSTRTEKSHFETNHTNSSSDRNSQIRD